MLRVLPRLKPLLGQGSPVSYQIELLGDDGQLFSFNMTHLATPQSVSDAFYQENLNDSFFGSLEWIFQQQNTSKRCDIALEYFPWILSSSNLKLKATSGWIKSLEEISHPTEVSGTLLKWRQRFEDLKQLSHRSKICLYEEAISQHAAVSGQRGRGGMKKYFLRSQFSSEQLYSLRRSFTSQAGLHSLLSYFLNQTPSTPRDLLLSVQNGSLFFQSPQKFSSHQQIPFRLSPTMIEAMTSLGAFKAAMGNTAVAMKEKKDLVQVLSLKIISPQPLPSVLRDS